MIKKLSAIALTAILVLTAFSPAFAAAQITDISDNWAKKEIQYFVDQGYILGYGDGTYLPERTVTRAEFIRIANNAFKFNQPANISFSDVHSADWFYNDVRCAVSAGYILGYQDNTFKPNNNITREEVAIIIQRILKEPNNTSYAPSVFGDVSSSSYYNGAIGAMTSMGVMKGISSSMFSPKSYETRDDTAYSLYNALFSGNKDNVVVDGNVIVNKSSYGPSSEFNKETVAKNVYVRSENSETTVRNLTVHGDFIIEETARVVILENVSIRGKLIVSGGSNLSLEKTDVQNMDVNNYSQRIRVDVSSDSVCYNTNVYTSCRLYEDSDAYSLGYSNVVIHGNNDGRTTVDLSGQFVVVDIYAPSTVVNLTRGQIADLYFYSSAESSTVDLSSNTKVDNADINAERVSINGEGALYSAKIEAANVKLGSLPENLTGSYSPSYTSDVEKYNLTVTVSNTSSAPIEGATVKVYGITKTTDAKGQASFASIPMGNHEYTVERTGFDTVSGTIDISSRNTTRNVTLSSSGRYTLTLTAQNSTSGSAINSASVELKNVSTVYTASNGQAAFRSLPTGVYTYTISASGYTTVTDTVTVNGANTSKTVKLALADSASYYADFYVTDSLTGNGVANAVVTVDNTIQGKTNASGYVRITKLGNGQHSYVINVTDYNLVTGVFTVSSKNERIDKVLVPSNLFTVVVNVRESGAGVIKTASVKLFTGSKTYTGTTDNNGTATLTGVAAASGYTLEVSHNDYVTETMPGNDITGNYTFNVQMTK